MREAHHALNGGAIHERICVQRQHELEGLAPTRTEVAQVAGFVSGVSLAATVGEANRIFADAVSPLREPCDLARRHGQIISVAEHKPRKACAFARRVKAFLDGAQPGEGAGRILVAQRHQNGCVETDGRFTRRCADKRRHNLHRIARQAQQRQSDSGVPHAEHAPRRGDGEAGEDRDIDDAPATHREDRPEPRHQARKYKRADGCCKDAAAL